LGTSANGRVWLPVQKIAVPATVVIGG